MKKILLPKPYLSYSARELWLRSKDQYRKRYYLGEEGPASPEMLFGKRIAKLLEEHPNDPLVAHIPRYTVAEYKIETEIDGVPTLAFLDSFEPDTLQFLDHKTSRKTSAGKDPWDRVRVAAHEQLPFYSMLVKHEHRAVHPVAKIVWIETEFDKQTHKGILATNRKMKLTGRVEVFERRIAEWERKRQRTLHREVAEAISEDYQLWKKHHGEKGQGHASRILLKNREARGAS